MATADDLPMETIAGHNRKKTVAQILLGFFFGRPARIALLLIFIAMILVPIFYIAMTSLKIPIEIRTSGAILPKTGITFENYVKAFRNVPLIRYLFNSLFVAVFSTILVLCVAVPATYSMVRFKTGGAFLNAWVLGTYVMPPIVVSIPILAMVKMVSLQDTLIGLALVHTMANMPIAVWLIDSYIRSLPKELEQAAWIDGYTKFQTLLKVVVPLIKPGIISAGVICAILSWNEFLFALIVTYGVNSNTFPIGISRYTGEHGLQFGEMSAAALVGIVPIYILVLLFSRDVVEGLTRGGVKG